MSLRYENNKSPWLWLWMSYGLRHYNYMVRGVIYVYVYAAYALRLPNFKGGIVWIGIPIEILYKLSCSNNNMIQEGVGLGFVWARISSAYFEQTQMAHSS